MNKAYSVRIGERHYSKDFQESANWLGVLTRAHGQHAICCCPGSGDKKLAIRLSGGKYHLARFPKTGAEHSTECRFYSPAPESSGMQGYVEKVVEEGEGGQLKIRLFRGLKKLEAKEAASEVADAPRAPGVRKTAMTTLGLLHLLWQEARLNTWYPAMEGKRNGGLVSWALLNAAQRVKAGRIEISEVLLLSADKGGKGQKANEDRVSRAMKDGLRVVVVAPLARYAEENNQAAGERLKLAGPFGMPSLYLNGQWARVQQRFEREISAWIAGEKVMAIALVDLKQGKTHPLGSVLDVGLMQVSERWIPLDSSYESVVEARLREEGRAFEKPLRFDSDEDVVFPDFWLLDTEKKDFPMEVFGIATPEYLARKDVKIRHYNREYDPDGWWHWNATDDSGGKDLPGFPAKRPSGQSQEQ